jgi:aryl-alcohol dehydrogenase-like predicted oxidoreductase
MRYRNLGRTGLKVSELCLGTMQFGWTADEATTFLVLNASYDAGLNFLDTADVYSRWVEGNPGGISESLIGKWMRDNNIPRDQVVIATKVRGRMGNGPNDEGLSRAHIFTAVENSLQRLNTDYIDLYQTHAYDPETPIDETLLALHDLVHQGKVRYIGCSNYPSWRLMQALWTSERLGITRYDSLQPHYNLVHRSEFERELSDVCHTYDLGVIPYSPLAGGFLTGKYRKDAKSADTPRARGASRYFNERNWNLLDKMETLGRDIGGFSISQVALSWMLSNPIITSPIIGPRNIEQLEDNIKSLDLHLEIDDIQVLNDASDWKQHQ